MPPGEPKICTMGKILCQCCYCCIDKLAVESFMSVMVAITGLLSPAQSSGLAQWRCPSVCLFCSFVCSFVYLSPARTDGGGDSSRRPFDHSDLSVTRHGCVVLVGPVVDS